MAKNSKPKMTLAVIAILLLFPMTVCAAPVLWIGDSDGQLGTVDLDTKEVTVIGKMDVPMQDIAFDPNGDLWGVSHNSLYKIDKQTAEQTLIGELGETRGSSLVFGPIYQKQVKQTRRLGFPSTWFYADGRPSIA